MLALNNISIVWIGLQAVIVLGAKAALLKELDALLLHVVGGHVSPTIEAIAVPLLVQSIIDRDFMKTRLGNELFHIPNCIPGL